MTSGLTYEKNKKNTKMRMMMMMMPSTTGGFVEPMDC
jgi:hypothetical protein